MIFTGKLYQKISRIYLNPMILFVCRNRQENKDGSTFLFIELEIHEDSHLVKLPTKYIFQIFPKSIFFSVFERFFESLIFSQKVAFYQNETFRIV